MRVAYSSSLYEWPTKEKGKVQRLNWQFSYLGQKRIIPCIYRFKRGIVFDLFTLVEEGAWTAFYNKYQAKEEERLSEAERRRIEEEHPYQSFSLAKVWLNEEVAKKGYSASGGFYSSLEPNKKMYFALKKAYARELKGSSCFGCERFCIPYPQKAEGFRKFRRLRRGDYIHHLKFITCEQE